MGAIHEQHHNPEFGHTWDEIKKNPQKSTLALRGVETQKSINVVSKLSFNLSFLFLEGLHRCMYVFTALPVRLL